MNAVTVIGIGKLGIVRLNEIIEMDYANDNCNYIAIDSSEEDIASSLADEKILSKQDSLHEDDIINIKYLLKNAKDVLIITALGGTTGSKITYEVLNIAKEINKFKMVIASYPFYYNNKHELKIAKKYKNKINDIADIPHIIYGDRFITKNPVDDLKNVNDETIQQFIRAYNLFWIDQVNIKNPVFVDVSQIVVNETKRNIAAKFFSDYDYYKKYIPLEVLELFIDFVYCYLMEKDEEYPWKCEYIANILAGMDFYNTEFNGSIIDLLYDLADTFKI